MVCDAGVEAELMEKLISLSKRRALILKFITMVLLLAAIETNFCPSAGAWVASRMRKSSVSGSSCSNSAPVAFTWKGTTNSSWSTATNWHGGVVPGTSDVAIFDNNCSTNCSLTAIADVGGIDIKCSFTGSINTGTSSVTVGASGITQAGGTFTVGSASLTTDLVNLSGGVFNISTASLAVGQGGWTQSGGTFNGGSVDMTISLEDTGATAFTLTGGTFNSTSANLTITNYHGTDYFPGTTLFSKSSSGSFVHNNGTVTFNGRDPWSGTDVFSIDVGSGNLDLYNVTIDDYGSYGQGHRIPAGQTITVLNTFNHLGGTLAGGTAADPDNWGEWILMGASNSFGDGAYPGNESYGTVRFKGTGDQTYTCTGGSETHGPHLKVQKPSGTLTTSSTDCSFASLELIQGSLTAPAGILSLNFYRDGSGNSDRVPDQDWTIFKIGAGTTFSHNNGTLRLWWRDTGGCCENGSVYIDVPSNTTFYNFTNQGNSGYWEGGGLKIAAGSVIVQNTFKWLGGRMFDDWTLQGDAYMVSEPGYTGAWGDGSGNGPATFTFSGTANQKLYTYGTTTGQGEMSLGDITVNKSSGTLTLDDNFTLPDAAQNMTVTAGTVQMAGYDLSVGANLTIDSGATVTCNNGILTYGSLTNNGTLNCTPATHTFASVGSIASAQNKTAQVNWSFAPSAMLDAGNLGVLVVSSDNYDDLDTDDGAIVSVTDSVGNIWKKRGEWQKGSTGAGTGVIVSIWTTIATTNLTTGGTITVNFWDDGVGPTAKAATGWEFTVTGSSALHVAGYSTLAENADPGNMTLSGLTSYPYLWIRAVGQENATTSWTSSTNYTTFTHTSSTTSGGVTATNIGARGEFRIFTGTTDSTNPSGVNADNASIYLAIQ